MGCDIHVIVEQFDDYSNVWFMTRHDIKDAETRNYVFFNALAGVRGGGPAKPNGIPNDISTGSRVELESWGLDAHSKSHMPLDKFMFTMKKYLFSPEYIADVKIRHPNLTKLEKQDYELYKDMFEHLTPWAVAWSDEQEKYIPKTDKFRVIFFFDN